MLYFWVVLVANLFPDFEIQASSDLHSGKNLALHWKCYKKSFKRRPDICVPATCMSVVLVKSLFGLLWELLFSLRPELKKAARGHWALTTLTALKVACVFMSLYLLLSVSKTSVSSIFLLFFDIFLLVSAPLSEGNQNIQLHRYMCRRDVCLSQRTLKPIFGAQELRLVPNLIWGPVVFTKCSEIWSPNSSIPNIFPQAADCFPWSCKIEDCLCCMWHQPNVEATLHWLRLDLNVEKAWSSSAMVLHSCARSHVRQTEAYH